MPEHGSCDDLGSFISELPGFEMVPHLVRLVAQGRPVRLSALAASSGMSLAAVEAALRTQPGTDWDERGDVVGFGLTQRPTAHRFIVSGRTLYTFCSTDALFFPSILGEPAVVESNCPATSRSIRIELTPLTVVSVDPPDSVVSQFLDPRLVSDVRANVCDQGHFFTSAEAASGWLRAHRGGRVRGVDEAFEHSRSASEALGWLAPTTSKR